MLVEECAFAFLFFSYFAFPCEGDFSGVLVSLSGLGCSRWYTCILRWTGGREAGRFVVYPRVIRQMPSINLSRHMNSVT